MPAVREVTLQPAALTGAPIDAAQGDAFHPPASAQQRPLSLTRERLEKMDAQRPPNRLVIQTPSSISRGSSYHEERDAKKPTEPARRDHATQTDEQPTQHRQPKLADYMPSPAQIGAAAAFVGFVALGGKLLSRR